MYGNITLIDSAFGITSYEAALKLHDSVSPIRGRPTEVRPLSTGRRDIVTICLNHHSPHFPSPHFPKPSVRIDHYGTTLLNYFPDDTVTISPYPSKTSGNVFTALLGSRAGRSMGFSQFWTVEEPGPVTQIGFKYYYTPDSFTVDLKATPYPAPIVPPPPFVVPTLDKSKAAKLNNQLVKPMAMWLKTAVKLGVDPRGDHYGALISDSLVYELLKDGQPGWAYVAKDYMSRHYSLEDNLIWLRAAVYEQGGAMVPTAYPYAEGYTELQRFRRRIKDWS
jgi:hypothetical protein